MKEFKEKGKLSRITSRESIMCGYCLKISMVGLAYIVLMENEEYESHFHCSLCSRSSVVDIYKGKSDLILKKGEGV